MELLTNIEKSNDTSNKIDLFKEWLKTGLVKHKQFESYFKDNFTVHLFDKELYKTLSELSKEFGTIEDYIIHLLVNDKSRKKTLDRRRELRQ